MTNQEQLISTVLNTNDTELIKKVHTYIGIVVSGFRWNSANTRQIKRAIRETAEVLEIY